jgi:hypothetical protein
MSYKSLLSETHAGKSVDAETIARCKVNEAKQKLNKVNAKIEEAAAKLGMTYDQWITQAKKFYTIIDLGSGDWIVQSVARSPNTPADEWPVADEAEGLEKVFQLISYKKYDHFVRGHDFAWRKA